MASTNENADKIPEKRHGRKYGCASHQSFANGPPKEEAGSVSIPPMKGPIMNPNPNTNEVGGIGVNVILTYVAETTMELLIEK